MSNQQAGQRLSQTSKRVTALEAELTRQRDEHEQGVQTMRKLLEQTGAEQKAAADDAKAAKRQVAELEEGLAEERKARHALQARAHEPAPPLIATCSRVGFAYLVDRPSLMRSSSW